MSGEAWDLSGLRQSSSADWGSPPAAQPQSPYASDESIDAWFSPTHLTHKAAAPVPPLALPGTQGSRHTKHLRLDPGQLPPSTPDPPETSQPAPAPGFSKPPRHSSSKHKPAGSGHMSFVSSPRVPVSWIGDSTDHSLQRPTSTSHANHEADTIKVASFVNAAKQADVQACQEQTVNKSKGRRWCKWTLLGAAAAGILIGTAYKLFGDYIDIDSLPLHRPSQRQTAPRAVAQPVTQVRALVLISCKHFCTSTCKGNKGLSCSTIGPQMACERLRSTAKHLCWEFMTCMLQAKQQCCC